ncbi:MULTISPECIES: hypothetical protein [Bacillus]|uniref:hypothetical protein n=1 Tax=Bacillus TaxID=1386 RepID=UPI0015956BA3|nr:MULTISPECIES: hypothetical protein [Bacillus]MEC1646061.1 hypothetical protein [Bacillus halotolerans]
MEKVVPEEFNWQIFKISYHPEGIGSLSNPVITEYYSDRVKAETVSFDSKQFYEVLG